MRGAGDFSSTKIRVHVFLLFPFSQEGESVWWFQSGYDLRRTNIVSWMLMIVLTRTLLFLYSFLWQSGSRGHTHIRVSCSFCVDLTIFCVHAIFLSREINRFLKIKIGFQILQILICYNLNVWPEHLEFSISHEIASLGNLYFGVEFHWQINTYS